MALSIRPSEYVGLYGFEAYCFDEAMLVLHSQIEERLAAVTKNEKDSDKAAAARSRWLTRYFGGPEAVTETKGHFRDPASQF